jgi:hypothetical protein
MRCSLRARRHAPAHAAQGSVLHWYRAHTQEAVEEKQRKMEKWQEIMTRKEKESQGRA